jgi:hypothetical protein
MISSEGSLSRAVNALFKERNITIEVKGDTSVFKEDNNQPKRGILIIGDHRQGLESAPALAFLGMMGRNDISFFSKPYSIPAKLINAALQGNSASDTILPVVPPELARGGSAPFFSGDNFFKIMNRGKLFSMEEALRLNIRSLKTAAQQLQEGRCVVMSPTSGVKDSLNEPWEKGLGLLLKNISPTHRNNIHILYARFENYSKTNLIWSMLGKRKSPLTLKLHLSEPISLDQVMHNNESASTDVYVRKVQEKVLASFRHLFD